MNDMTSTRRLHATPTPVSEQAFRSIYDMIISGQLQPGQWLLEADLSEALGVSRTPVRDALRRLIEHGLAETCGRGVAVTKLDLARVQELYDFRAALEALAAELAAQRSARGEIPAAAIDELRRINQSISGAAEGGNVGVVSGQNMMLHHRIAELAHNGFLLDALGKIWDIIAISATALFTDQRWGVRVHSHHAGIIEAIASGNSESARDIAREHVVNSKRVYTEIALANHGQSGQERSAGHHYDGRIAS